MGYIEQSLGKDEVLVARAPIHWLPKAFYWLTFIVAEGLAVWAGIYHSNIIVMPVFLVLLAVVLLLFLIRMIPIWCIEIGVTDYRVILKQGCISRRTEELGLHAIEEVSLTQSLWGRLFNFGDLEIHGTGDDKLNIDWIAAPVAFRRAIETARERAMRNTSNPKG